MLFAVKTKPKLIIQNFDYLLLEVSNVPTNPTPNVGTLCIFLDSIVNQIVVTTLRRQKKKTEYNLRQVSGC